MLRKGQIKFLSSQSFDCSFESSGNNGNPPADSSQCKCVELFELRTIKEEASRQQMSPNKVSRSAPRAEPPGCDQVQVHSKAFRSVSVAVRLLSYCRKKKENMYIKIKRQESSHTCKHSASSSRSHSRQRVAKRTEDLNVLLQVQCWCNSVRSRHETPEPPHTHTKKKKTQSHY